MAAYLSALADGDSAAAMTLDAAAFDDAPFTQADGTGFLATDALATASERIAVTGTKVLSTNADDAAVEADFSLAGENFSPTLRLRWDDDSGKWILIDSLANLLVVRTVNPAGTAGPAPFTLGDAVPSGSFEGFDPPVTAVYPGVYALSVQLDAALLLDPATALKTQLVVRPYYQAPHTSVLAPTIDFALR